MQLRSQPPESLMSPPYPARRRHIATLRYEPHFAARLCSRSVATSRTPGPLLASRDARQSDGFNSGTGYAVPGLLGLAEGDGAASGPQMGGVLDLDHALASREGVSFRFGADTYRVRLASRGASPGEEPVARQRALSILGEVISGPGQADDIAGLLPSDCGNRPRPHRSARPSDSVRALADVAGVQPRHARRGLWGPVRAGSRAARERDPA
jgi:hypothetical protein